MPTDYGYLKDITSYTTWHKAELGNMISMTRRQAHLFNANTLILHKKDVTLHRINLKNLRWK